MKLQYDTALWEERNRWKNRDASPHNILQMFITNRCNKRCRGCFYDPRLGSGDMDYSYYTDLVDQYASQINKVILIGGEPTLHPRILDMAAYNQSKGIRTTVYTNGTNLEMFAGYDMSGASLWVGILGVRGTEKNLEEVKTSVPITVVNVLRTDNVWQLPIVAKYAEDNFNCRGMMLTSIRDVAKTKSFWIDTSDTLSNQTYAEIVSSFVATYRGNIPKLHISRRTVIEGTSHNDTCRYLNVFPNGEKTICTWDIPLGITDGEGYQLGTRKCQKNNECIYQKVVLKRRRNGEV